MFCQLDRLRRCPPSDIRQALDKLPETLDESYERTLLDIDDENWVYAHRLFQCTLVAHRPLHVEELADFLAFKSEGGSLKFERNRRPEDPRDRVLSTCSSLIAVVDVDSSPVMQFSHFSVKEYLTSSRIVEGRVSRYHTLLEPAHLFVTQACLSLLLLLDKHVNKESIKEFPLAHYAGRYWADHAEFGNISSHAEDMMIRLFSPENPHFSIWAWIYDPIYPYKSMESEAPTRPEWAPLHYAAYCGFHRVAELLVTSCSQDVNVSGVNSFTPLHIACRDGRFTVVQVLLKHQADVNARTVYGSAPLHFMSYSAHHQLEIARLLIEHAAHVNLKNDLGWTPLSLLSIRNGNLEVAEMLLKHGADPNIRSKYYRGPLYAALHMGHSGLAQLVLKHGANPNSRDVDGRTLLHLACLRGNLKVVRGLLELGVGVNSRDNGGQTPLQVALRNKKEKVVQLLLQHGAERT